MHAPAAPKILVYDGDCRMCRAFSRIATRRWLCGNAERRPAADFVGDEAVRLQEAGVHNEMAVLDPATGEIRSGYDGVVWLLRGGRLRWLAPLLAWRPVATVLRHDYRVVAYNRRIFSPPRRDVACACDPDFHVGYRWAFVGLALLWTVLLGGVLGGLFTGRPWGAALAAPAGGLVAALPALRMGRERGLTWTGHVAWILAAAMLPLLLGLVVLAGQSLLWRMGALDAPWAASPDARRTLGLVAWGLAGPVVAVSCLHRLPRVGAAPWQAGVAAAVLWGTPLLVLRLL